MFISNIFHWYSLSQQCIWNFIFAVLAGDTFLENIFLNDGNFWHVYAHSFLTYSQRPETSCQQINHYHNRMSSDWLFYLMLPVIEIMSTKVTNDTFLWHFYCGEGGNIEYVIVWYMELTGDFQIWFHGGRFISLYRVINFRALYSRTSNLTILFSSSLE